MKNIYLLELAMYEGDLDNLCHALFNILENHDNTYDKKETDFDYAYFKKNIFKESLDSESSRFYIILNHNNANEILGYVISDRTNFVHEIAYTCVNTDLIPSSLDIVELYTKVFELMAGIEKEDAGYKTVTYIINEDINSRMVSVYEMIGFKSIGISEWDNIKMIVMAKEYQC